MAGSGGRWVGGELENGDVVGIFEETELMGTKRENEIRQGKIYVVVEVGQRKLASCWAAAVLAES